MNIAEAQEILQKNRKVIGEWCEKGILKANKIPDKIGNGFRWDIEKSSVYKKKVELDEKEEKKLKKPKPKPNHAYRLSEVSGAELEPSQNNLSGEINKGITRAEAERLLKIEQAIEKRRENELEEGNLVDIRELEVELLAIYQETWDAMRELIDGWTIGFNLSLEVSKKMRDDFEQSLGEMKRRSIEKSHENKGNIRK